MSLQHPTDATLGELRNRLSDVMNLVRNAHHMSPEVLETYLAELADLLRAVRAEIRPRPSLVPAPTADRKTAAG